MKKPAVRVSTQQTFVITAVFLTQRTVQADSLRHAFELAETTLVNAGATGKDLCNWYAHAVEGEEL